MTVGTLLVLIIVNSAIIVIGGADKLEMSELILSKDIKYDIW